MPCNDEQLREELIHKIMKINSKYSRELVERAITACCKEEPANIEDCAIERARQLYLIEYKR